MYKYTGTPTGIPTNVAHAAGSIASGDATVPRALTPAMLGGMILRRKALVLACGLLVAGIGLGVGVLVPAKYIAYAQLIIDPTDLRVTDKSLRTPSQFSDALVAQVENQVRVITSASVLDRVIATQHLDEDDEFNGARSPGIIGATIGFLRDLIPSSDPSGKPSPTLSARRELEKNIGAKRDERTYVVNISAKTLEPAKSVRLADAVLDGYLAATAEARDSVGKRIAGSLDDRITELRGAVEKAERRVEDYRRKNNMVAAVGSSVTEQQLANSSSRLQTATNAVAQAQSRYDQVQQARSGGGDGGAIPDALQSTTVMNLRTQVTEVQRKASDLMATRGPRHPEVIEIKAQEATVRRALTDELGRIAASAKTDLDRARTDERALKRSFDTLKGAVNTQDEAAVRLRELERAVQASRSVYEAYLTRAKEVSEQVNVDVANVRVIGRAQLPERRSFPPRTLFLVGGGLVLGLLLGAGLAMLRGMIQGDADRIATRPRPAPAMALVRT